MHDAASRMLWYREHSTPPSPPHLRARSRTNEKEERKKLTSPHRAAISEAAPLAAPTGPIIDGNGAISVSINGNAGRAPPDSSTAPCPSPPPPPPPAPPLAAPPPPPPSEGLESMPKRSSTTGAAAALVRNEHAHEHAQTQAQAHERVSAGAIQSQGSLVYSNELCMLMYEGEDHHSRAGELRVCMVVVLYHITPRHITSHHARLHHF